MVAVNLKGFGGMIPALGDRLIPQNNAADAENTWLYSGELIGINKPKLLHSNSVVGASTVYRIPLNYASPRTMDNSLWLEFVDRDTDVIRAPIVGDTFDRYYWVSPTQIASYNTRDRITFNSTPVSATVTSAAATDLVSWTGHPFTTGDPVTFAVSGGGILSAPLVAATTYYVCSAGLTANSFKLSTTPTNATAGTAIDLTTDSTATVTGHSGTKGAWTLGIPAPANAPGGSVAGGAAANVTRSYVYTWVSAYGEEGPPSPPFVLTGHPDGTWNMTMTAADPNDLGIVRNLSKVRLYRTVTDANGVATYYLVVEQAIGTTTYADTVSDTTLVTKSQLESSTTLSDGTVVTWAAPPTDLAGWVLMPNGIFAAWRSNELWFSEPYRPHAWPAAYAIAVDYPIVGMGVVNQTLVVCTTGFPLTATGSTPSTITTSKLTSFEQCISRGSIVPSPEGVYYASPSGMVLVNPGQSQNITEQLITKDKWQAITNLTQLRVGRLGTGLYAYGSLGGPVFYTSGFETTAFVQQDTTGAHTGWFMDLVNQNVGFVLLNDTTVTNLDVLNDPWSGELFLVYDGTPTTVYWLDTGQQQPTLTPYLWRSKVFQTEYPTNLAASRIFFNVPAGTDDLPPAGFGPLLGTGLYDSAKLSTGVTLTPDSMTAIAATADYGNVIGKDTVNSTQVFTVFLNEFDITDTDDIGVGLANASASLTVGNKLGFDTNSLAWYGFDGKVYYNNAVVATLETFGPGDMITVVVDYANNKLWVRRNAGLWNSSLTANPVTGTGAITISATGPFFPAVSMKGECAATLYTDARAWYGTFRVYANNQLQMVRELRTSGDIWKMPAGFKADFWQFEVESRVQIFSIEAANTEKELRIGQWAIQRASNAAGENVLG